MPVGLVIGTLRDSFLELTRKDSTALLVDVKVSTLTRGGPPVTVGLEVTVYVLVNVSTLSTRVPK